MKATKSGCGQVRLTSAGKLDLHAALRSATRGYRAIYLRQVRPTEPIELLGVRAQSIAHGTVPETFVLGAVQVTLPVGLYRLCVVSDRPVAFDIPTNAVRGRVHVTTSPVRSRAATLAGQTSGVGMTKVTATTKVTTKSSSVLFAAGAVRLPAAPADTYDFGTCPALDSNPCTSDKPLYGTGTKEMGSGGASGTTSEYWSDSEAGPGTFEAGVVYAGTRRPDAVLGFVLTIDL